MQRAVVGVMGSGRERHDVLAAPLGRHLAARGVHLLTGGGGGVMAAVSEAFAAAPHDGLVIGVLPGPEPRPGYPNPHVELAIRTHLPLSGAQGTDAMSRNHINVLSAHAIIALPGGEGTRSEVALALRYGRPVALHGWACAFGGWPSAPPRMPSLEGLQRWLTAVLGPIQPG